jgi:hypothetical protein
MRIKALAFAVSLLLVSSSSAGIQQTSTTSTSSAQASVFLAQSAKALTGSTVINDVTLTGIAEWIAGSDDETGTATYKGLSGSYRLDISLRNGTRSEIVSPVGGVPSGSWIGLDNTLHPVANHNLMSDSGWFPTFTLVNLISSSNMVLAYVGQETRNGVQVIHISVSQQFPNLPGNSSSFMQHLTQVDVYLDSTTLLPTSYLFNLHPDDNALLDIPTEIRYSNYQTLGGAQIPLHVQKYVNNTLTIDLQFQNATLNSGLTAAQFSVE